MARFDANGNWSWDNSELPQGDARTIDGEVCIQNNDGIWTPYTEMYNPKKVIDWKTTLICVAVCCAPMLGLLFS